MHAVPQAALRGALVALDTVAEVAGIVSEAAEQACAHIVDRWLCPVPDDAKTAERLRT